MKEEENQDYLNYFNDGKPNWERFGSHFIALIIWGAIMYIGFKLIF